MLKPEDIVRLVRERAGHPASAKELVQLLDVPREQRATFRRQLRALAAEGTLVEVRGHRYGVAEKMDLVVGRLQAIAGGSAFVVPDTPRPGGDVFVPAAGREEAMHGDRVVARIERHRAGDRPEGRIVKILHRANPTVVGRFDLDSAGLGFVSPSD